MEIVVSLLSAFGAGGIVLFFIKRAFEKRDRAAAEVDARRESLFRRIETSLETLRLLSYHRLSQEIERLLDQGYASPAERRVLDEMYANYKDHGWNGDMEERLHKVYALRTDRADGQ